MVRNTTGGSKTKSQARKSFVKSDTTSSIRTPQNEFELIATVTKLLGNGMCYVSIPSFPDPLICHIRGKFRGRSKKHNIVNIGSTILVGLRDWESPHFKNTDLLHILNTSTPSTSLYDIPHDNILFSHSADTLPLHSSSPSPSDYDNIHFNDIDFNDI
jgi:hypothetical protein